MTWYGRTQKVFFEQIMLIKVGKSGILKDSIKILARVIRVCQKDAECVEILPATCDVIFRAVAHVVCRCSWLAPCGLRTPDPQIKNYKNQLTHSFLIKQQYVILIRVDLCQLFSCILLLAWVVCAWLCLRCTDVILEMLIIHRIINKFNSKRDRLIRQAQIW
jgi:hypothetical protein